MNSTASHEQLDSVLATPYISFLGVHYELGEDGLVVSLPFGEHLVGNTRLPALHGGAIGAFLETAAMMELLLKSGSLPFPKTIGFTVQYLRSGKPRETHARSRITKHGRRVANVSVEAWQKERDRPIATGQGHFLLPG